MSLLGPEAIATLVRTRRDIHAHPELAFTEQRTHALIAERLHGAGLAVRENVAGTGVVAMLEGNRAGPVLVLRADMDALPLQERTDVSFRSTVDGIMHACGHDAHTAILLTVAEELAARREQLRGCVQFIFQPAEEVGAGAPRMLEDDVVITDTADAVVGLHMHAHIAAGFIGVCRGPATAVASRFAIRVNGKGGHGAFPEQSADPIVAVAHIIAALQTLISRELSSSERAVLSVCQVNAGTAFNIIPDVADIAGTMRTNSPHAQELLTRRADELAGGIARSFRCTAEFTLDELVPQVINDETVSDGVRRSAERVVGAASVVVSEPVMAADDVAFFMRTAPSCYFFVGAAYTDGRPQTPHHSSLWDVDERALAVGAEVLLGTALDYLSDGEAAVDPLVGAGSTNTSQDPSALEKSE
ncbi:MAG: M20 family metallopeptidase [Candidatus Dormibacteraeota bacterium]|nr:M20 family metallopeptidase [Candidatus Dormibacteraeota bacterium]